MTLIDHPAPAYPANAENWHQWDVYLRLQQGVLAKRNTEAQEKLADAQSALAAANTAHANAMLQAAQAIQKASGLEQNLLQSVLAGGADVEDAYAKTKALVTRVTTGTND